MYHCCVSLLTSRYRPLKAASTCAMLKAHTAELPDAPLYLQTREKGVVLRDRAEARYDLLSALMSHHWEVKTP